MSEPLTEGERWMFAAVYGAAAVTGRSVQGCEDVAECVITVLRARIKSGKGGAMLRDMLGAEEADVKRDCSTCVDGDRCSAGRYLECIVETAPDEPQRFQHWRGSRDQEASNE